MSVCDSAIACFLYRYWVRLHAENSWRSFYWPDNFVHSNTIWAWKSIGRTTSQSESIDGSIEQQCWRAGHLWTASGSEGTVSNPRWICVCCRCHHISWPQFVFVLQILVVQVEQWLLMCLLCLSWW